MAKNDLVMIEVQRDIVASVPSPEVLRKGQLLEVPEYIAETLIPHGDVRLYGPRYEDKSLPGPTINKNAQELADKLGIDVQSVEGSGRGGRITKADIEKYAEAAGLVEEE